MSQSAFVTELAALAERHHVLAAVVAYMQRREDGTPIAYGAVIDGFRLSQQSKNAAGGKVCGLLQDWLIEEGVIEGFR